MQKSSLLYITKQKHLQPLPPVSNRHEPPLLRSKRKTGIFTFIRKLKSGIAISRHFEMIVLVTCSMRDCLVLFISWALLCVHCTVMGKRSFQTQRTPVKSTR